MRALAEYVMRGPAQAVMTTIVLASLPLLLVAAGAGGVRILAGLAATVLISFAAGVVALVTLRLGWRDCMLPMAAGLVPSVVWYGWQDEGTPLVLMLVTPLLAQLLRDNRSWGRTLMLASIGGAVLALLLEWIVPAQVAGLETLIGQMRDAVGDQNPELAELLASASLKELVLGGLVAGHLTSALGSLLIGRWWQAMLYNPGGLGEELRRLRMPPAFSIAALAVLFTAGMGVEAVMRWLPLMVLPLVLAGVALVHAIVVMKKLGRSWLIAFYAVAFLAGPYLMSLLVLLAVADSLIDFRRRMTSAT